MTRTYTAHTMSGLYFTGNYKVHGTAAIDGLKYGQCGITKSGESEILISYITPVAAVIHTGGFRWLAINGLYSRSTARHISLFAARYNVPYSTIKRLAGTDYIYNVDTGEIKNVGRDNIQRTIDRFLSRSTFYYDKIK